MWAFTQIWNQLPIATSISASAFTPARPVLSFSFQNGKISSLTNDVYCHHKKRQEPELHQLHFRTKQVQNKRVIRNIVYVVDQSRNSVPVLENLRDLVFRQPATWYLERTPFDWLNAIVAIRSLLFRKILAFFRIVLDHNFHVHTSLCGRGNYLDLLSIHDAIS